MLPPGKLLVVLADGGNARFIERSGHPSVYRTERTIQSATLHQQSSDLGTDAPGRAFESASPTRHGVAPRSDLHEMEKQRFLQQVATLINDGAAADAFEGLVIAAPPRALHELREALSAEATRRLVTTLTKDLVKIPDHEIGDHLLRGALG